MDFDDTPEEAAVRADALAWLDANAKLSDPSQIDEMRTHRAHTEEDDEALIAEARAWQQHKADAGWAAPQWPSAYGRS